MSRYIDADVAINLAKEEIDNGTPNDIAWKLEALPTADVASVTINEYGRLVIDVSNLKDIMHGRAFEIYFGKEG